MKKQLLFGLVTTGMLVTSLMGCGQKAPDKSAKEVLQETNASFKNVTNKTVIDASFDVSPMLFKSYGNEENDEKIPVKATFATTIESEDMDKAHVTMDIALTKSDEDAHKLVVECYAAAGEDNTYTVWVKTTADGEESEWEDTIIDADEYADMLDKVNTVDFLAYLSDFEYGDNTKTEYVIDANVDMEKVFASVVENINPEILDEETCEILNSEETKEIFEKYKIPFTVTVDKKSNNLLSVKADLKNSVTELLSNVEQLFMEETGEHISDYIIINTLNVKSENTKIGSTTIEFPKELNYNEEETEKNVA